MSAPSASSENALKRVKELPTLNKVYLYLYLNRCQVKDCHHHDLKESGRRQWCLPLVDSDTTLTT